MTDPACAESPDLEIVYLHIQPIDTNRQVVMSALVVSKDDGRGWSCVFTFGISKSIVNKESSCRPLKYDGKPSGGLTAVSSSGNDMPGFPSFVTVDKAGRYATGCVVSRSDQTPAPTACGTAVLK